MLIRILKTLPAPLMDGFDVRGLHTGQSYNVDYPLGRYLLIAGYAERLDESAPDKSKPPR